MYNYIENKQTKSLNDTLTVNGKNVYLADIEETWQKYANLGLVRAEECQICVVPKPEQLAIRVCLGRNANIDDLNSLSLLQIIITNEMEKELKAPISVSLSAPRDLYSAEPNAKKAVNLSNPVNDMLTVNGLNVRMADVRETWQKLVNRGLVSPIGYKTDVLPKSEQLLIKVCPGRNANIDDLKSLSALQNIVTYEMRGKLNNIPLSVSLSERKSLRSAEPNAKKVIILQNPVAAKLIGAKCREDR